MIEMQVREAIKQISGFRYLIDRLELRSGVGRERILHQPWMECSETIEKELEKTEQIIRVAATNPPLTCKFRKALERVKNIRGTIKRLSENTVLDDLELFEIKNFASAVVEIRAFTEYCPVVELPDLTAVFVLLDPENTGISHFYIYDVYSPDLAALRKEIRLKKSAGEEEVTEALYFKSVEIEDRVRGELTVKLQGYKESLSKALEGVAHLDVLQAKALLAVQLDLCRPEVCVEGGEVYTAYEGLFHPEIKDNLQRNGKDIVIRPEVTLITGANMAGKTVLLKSVALAQCLCQFGFYVPAKCARVASVAEVAISSGDGQDELSGLSSFAAEMLCVDRIIREVKAGRKILVLIDELARTTNPAEGRALVCGVVELLAGAGVPVLITTHYSGIEGRCRRLRVRGFREEKIEGALTLANVTSFIDYSLVEEEREEVPREAIRIAEILGVDGELLEKARRVMEKENRIKK